MNRALKATQSLARLLDVASDLEAYGIQIGDYDADYVFAEEDSKYRYFPCVWFVAKIGDAERFIKILVDELCMKRLPNRKTMDYVFEDARGVIVEAHLYGG